MSNAFRLPRNPFSGSLGDFADSAFLLAFVLTLAIISRYNYLLFHCLVEASIAGMSFVAFAFAWNCRRFEHGYLLILGIAEGFSGLFSLLHAVSYDGMNVLHFAPGYNLAPQFWLASRTISAVTLLVAPFYLARPLPLGKASLGLGLLALFLLLAITLGYAPDCYVPGRGLTPFKIFYEYSIAAAILASAILSYLRRRAFAPHIRPLMATFFGFTIAAELMFTVYPTMFSTVSVAGHLMLLFATYAFYKAIVETGIRRPFDLLFRELKDAIQARDEFLSIASHELKTPLTPLKMQLQGLRRMMKPEKLAQLVPEQVDRNLEISTKQIDRLTYLIDNLLDVSRISAGKLALRRESTDVKSIYNEILARHEGELKAAGVELTLDVPEVPLILEADLLRLDQVVTNLFMNALKYAPGSRVNLGARREGHYALLWIEDSGPGIPRAAQARIFERFERAQPSDKVTGLGLGLFISRQIVEAHGGTLRLKSEPGQGSRFELRLPLPEAPHPPAPGL